MMVEWFDPKRPMWYKTTTDDWLPEMEQEKKVALRSENLHLFILIFNGAEKCNGI